MTTEADRNDMQRLIEANDAMLAQRDEQIRGLEARLTTTLGLLQGAEQACGRLRAELRVATATGRDAEAECEQWQKKLTEDAWPEIERLRAATDAAGEQLVRENRQLRTHLDLLREICKPGLEDAPDGPATFLRAARKILDRYKRA